MAREGPAGAFKYEVIAKDGEDLLYVYLPKDVASSAFPTYDEHSQKSGQLIIYFDTPEGQHVGSAEVSGFVLPDPVQAKFNRKQGRYTFNLLKAGKAGSTDEDRDSTAPQDVDQEEHYSDASSSGPDEPQRNRSSDQPALDMLYQQATAGNGHADDLSDEQLSEASDQQQQEEQEQPAAPVSRGIPQPQAGRAAAGVSTAAEVNGNDHPEGSVEEEEEEEEVDDEAEGGAADGDEGQVKKGKKRRGQKKKKKKKNKGGAAEGADETQQGGSSSAAAVAAAADSTAAAAAGGAQSSKEDDDNDVFFDAPESISDEDGSGNNSNTASPTKAAPADAAQALASGKAGRPAQIDAHAGPAVPESFHSENYLEFFSEEPCAGITMLPTQTDEPLQPASLLQGPVVASCLDRHEYKGEDKGLKLMGASWTPTCSNVGTPFSAFGIFDGHGGKSAATFASKELLPTVTKLLDHCKTAGPPVPSSARQSVLSPRASAAGPGFELGEEGETWGVEVTEQDRAVWAAQEAMAERLPMAMFAGFLEADKICQGRFKVSGTTATLAVVVGWEVFVANVGDSAAYLDTGKQVICLTGNHRVDDNPAERERVIASGGTIERSKDLDTGEFLGPNRVWPGGLNMCRTIGDPQAPQVIAVPEVRHVTVPTTGGRIIICSDGVWDHMQPKGMIHQVRNDNTEAAAKKISAAAIKKKGLRDDISVLVIDLLPQLGDVRPPALLQGPAREAAESCQVLRPLLEASLADGTGDIARSSSGQLGSASSSAAASSSDRHWKDAAAARHAAALRLLRAQARAAAEAQAEEQRRAEERAAAIAAAAAESAQSETYMELMNLKVDTEELKEQLTRQHQERLAAQAAARAAAAAEAAKEAEAAAAGEAEGWVTVKSSSRAATGAGADEEDGYVPIEQQLRAHARQYEQPAPPDHAAAQAAAGPVHARRGRGGRGRGRGGRDGRDYRSEYQQQHADPAEQQQGRHSGDLSHHQHPEEFHQHQQGEMGFRGGRGGLFGGRGGPRGGRGGRFAREYRPRGSDEHAGGEFAGGQGAEHEGGQQYAPQHAGGQQYEPHRRQHHQHQQQEQWGAEGEHAQHQERPYRGRGGRGGRGRGRFGGDFQHQQQHPQGGDDSWGQPGGVGGGETFGDSFAGGSRGDAFGGQFHRGPGRQQRGYDQQRPHYEQHHPQHEQQQQQAGGEGGEDGQHQQQYPGRGRGGRRGGRGGRGGRAGRGEGSQDPHHGAADAPAAEAGADARAPPAAAEAAVGAAISGLTEGAADVRVVPRPRRARGPRGPPRGAGQGESAGSSPRVGAEGAGNAAFRSERGPSNLQQESGPGHQEGAAGGGGGGAPAPEGAGRGGRGGRGRRGGGRGAERSFEGGEGGEGAPVPLSGEGHEGARGGRRGGRGGGRGPQRSFEGGEGGEAAPVPHSGEGHEGGRGRGGGRRSRPGRGRGEGGAVPQQPAAEPTA